MIARAIEAVGDAACWLVLCAGYLLGIGVLCGILTAPVEGAPRTISVRATAYSWREADHRRWGSKNAIGGSLVRPKEGMGHCAVDPRVIPMGSILDIPGAGPRIATDTGRLIKGHDIDVHFYSLRIMRRWGARRVTVRVLRWGWGRPS